MVPAVVLVFSVFTQVLLPILIMFAAGWALGGTVGFGTVAFALFIGPSVGYGLRLVDLLGGTGETITSQDAPASDA